MGNVKPLLKFAKEFIQTVKDADLKTNPLPKGSPNLATQSVLV